MLQRIATEASGFYLPLQGANPVETLYARGLAPLPKTEESTRLTRVYRERYHWPLGFAVLCLVIEALLPECPRARRTEKAPAAGVLAQTAALLVFVLTALGAYGSPSSAYHDFQAGNFGDSFAEYNRLSEKKTNDYRLHYDAGAAAYKAKKLDSALEQFDAALNSADIISDPKAQQHAYYNLGNTLYRAGEPLSDMEKKEKFWQASVENFSHALRLNANDLDAKNNLAYVKQKIEQLKQQQQQQQQQNQDKKDQKNQDQKDQQQQQGQDKKDDKNQQQQSAKQDQQKKDQTQDKKSEQQKKDEEKARQEQAKKAQEKKSPAGPKGR